MEAWREYALKPSTERDSGTFMYLLHRSADIVGTLKQEKRYKTVEATPPPAVPEYKPTFSDILERLSNLSNDCAFDLSQGYLNDEEKARLFNEYQSINMALGMFAAIFRNEDSQVFNNIERGEGEK